MSCESDVDFFDFGEWRLYTRKQNRSVFSRLCCTALGIIIIVKFCFNNNHTRRARGGEGVSDDPAELQQAGYGPRSSRAWALIDDKGPPGRFFADVQVRTYDIRRGLYKRTAVRQSACRDGCGITRKQEAEQIRQQSYAERRRRRDERPASSLLARPGACMQTARPASTLPKRDQVDSCSPPYLTFDRIQGLQTPSHLRFIGCSL